MEAAAGQFGRMVCDVNIEPRNDVSLAFHAARGYREVGELAHGDLKTVALMSKELSAPHQP
jgi:predicted GNAT superfamily acetyltransferase